MTKAIIYIPKGEFDPHAGRCMRHSNQRGYNVEGVVRGDPDAAGKMLRDGTVNAIVVSRPDHRDARWPRVEVVADEDLPQGDGQPGRPEHRRPRPLD
jgi:hypothetical protein